MTQNNERIVRKADRAIERAQKEEEHMRSLLTTIRSTERFVQTFVERRHKNVGHRPERRRSTNGAHA